MKTSRFKQMACISENDAESFQDKVNAVLSRIPEPEIIVDRTRPFTIYVLYTVSKTMPEDVLEMLMLLDPDASTACCIDCPAFIPDSDRRRKWGRCQLRSGEFKQSGPACEFYYLKRRDSNHRIVDELKQMPYLIE